MGEGEMSEELKPCPFCGGEAELKIQRADEEHSYSFVRCKKCLVSTDHYYDVYPPGTDAVWRWYRRTPPGTDAVWCWNRRTPPAAVPEGWEPTPDMVEAARSVVRQILVDAAYEFRADRRKSSAMFAAEVLVSNAMANAIKAAMISAAPAAPTEGSDE